ncbi:MAG: dihydrofolate reductase [Paracoccaceae bacterium]
MISLIVARARDGAIGKDGIMPWHIPEDLAFFQRETFGGAIIMGRNTWHALPKSIRPLKGRLNILVTTRGEPEAENVFPSLDEAIEFAWSQGYARIYGVGGARVYRELLPRANRLLLTEVDTFIEGADTFFPDFDPDEWILNKSIPLRSEDPACVLSEHLRKIR